MKNTKVFLTKWKMLLLISEAVPDPGQKAGGLASSVLVTRGS